VTDNTMAPNFMMYVRGVITTSLWRTSCAPLFRIDHGITNEHKVCPMVSFPRPHLDVEIPTIPRWRRRVCTRSAAEDVWVTLCMDTPIERDETMICSSYNSMKVPTVFSSAARPAYRTNA